ncbi:hypothetical protein LTR56_002820 [Elasticomyces elasticus]|nr:hypothetical protein LTR56_002820 [Elasticomyces elasticus]KAK4920435.1 hypothetical protein LTR49_012027 [Elasticomyces elasticus]
MYATQSPIQVEAEVEMWQPHQWKKDYCYGVTKIFKSSGGAYARTNGKKMAAQALTIPELLENMLLQLPTKDLLFAQKVCKAWKLAIQSSPGIQRALFFQPGAVADVYQPGPLAPGVSDCELKLFKNHIKVQGVALNPLLFSLRAGQVGEGVAWDREYDDLIFYVPALKARSVASCNRMWMTQPPSAICAEYEVEEWYEQEDVKNGHERALSDAGFVVDQVRTSERRKYGDFSRSYATSVRRAKQRRELPVSAEVVLLPGVE